MATLDTPLSEIIRLNINHKNALGKLKIETIHDILYYFPRRYGNTAEAKAISSVQEGDTVTLFGKITKLKTQKSFRSNVPRTEGTLEDDTGSIKIIWFAQPYLAKMISENTIVRIDGKISKHKDTLTLTNPKIEKVGKMPLVTGTSLFNKEGSDADSWHLYPIYPETKGITSNWIYHTIQKVFGAHALDTITDPLPESLLSLYNLPSLATALIWIHAPKKESDALAARKRFAFEEVFFIQLEKALTREKLKTEQSFNIDIPKEKIDAFMDSLPFSPTGAQHRAIEAIQKDFASPHPMMRLLEGDVGSGKTAVAAATVFGVAQTRPQGQSFGSLQVAYMVPTEVLAKQQFESFIQYFKNFPIPIALITGNECRKFPSKTDPDGSNKISKAQLKKWVANGEIPVVVGTHALIQKTVAFKHLAYIIIDEQHKFGTAQRKRLTEKDTRIPHLLSMTATPIPRTLALTVYGDLDITVLDEMPKGRKPIKTKLVMREGRTQTYEAIRYELQHGRQAYVICPRIDEPDPNKSLALNAKSVKEEAKRLKANIFPEYEIGILHSKMTPIEKEKIMQSFKDGTIDILCATSVVEVGVNVPNATVILIEGAERFGLAQLHQLRGRVIRSNHQAYCFLFSESASNTSRERLKALESASDGFTLAEMDLKLRGNGELYGKKQSGLSDLGMEALQNIKMVEAARSESAEIARTDTQLKKHPLLKEALEQRVKSAIHFE